jgi:hypothetical protein
MGRRLSSRQVAVLSLITLYFSTVIGSVIGHCSWLIFTGSEFEVMDARRSWFPSAFMLGASYSCVSLLNLIIDIFLPGFNESLPESILIIIHSIVAPFFSSYCVLRCKSCKNHFLRPTTRRDGFLLSL